MNVLIRSASRIIKGAAKAFQTYPAAIASALAFTIVTIIRIQLDWPEQEAYNFLFNCLHWSFAMAAIFSLAAITAAQSRYDQPRAFKIANLMGAAAAAVTFLVLYLLGETDPALEGARYAMVSGIAASRVSAAMLVSFLTFIVLAGYPKDQSDFARSFFMTHKAFFIALIYGLVIMGGASGVAGAVEVLLYNGMSEKVYMYIAAIAGFLGFTIFAGYFPDFRKGETDEHREAAQKQPRFIEMLFGFIMIPIVLALTGVLLIWAGRIPITGTWPPFMQLSGIAAGYSVGGIWLHIMVTHHESGAAKFYRGFYPIAALVILAFEAWALVIQLGKSGLKMEEYSFSLIWIIAVAAAVLLLIRKAKAHTAIVVLACALAVFSVLPGVGYHALPVTAQANRLETLLVSQGMLEGDGIIPAAAEPELAVREAITDSVSYLAHARDAKLPAWFDKRLSESEVFKTKLGFEQTWPKPEENYGGNGRFMGTSLFLPRGAIDISDYRWAVNMQGDVGKAEEFVTIDGTKGSYRIEWRADSPDGIPSLKIRLDDRVILEKDMNDYIDRISEKFPPGQGESHSGSLADMSLQLETPEISVLLVFSNIDINVDAREDVINYWLNLSGLYLKEK